MWSSRRTAAGLLLTAALSASACGYTAQAEGDGDQPAKVESINGSDQGKIILTANAAKRIGLKLTPVTEQTVNHDVVVRGTVVADPGSPTRAWIRVPIRSRELAAVDSAQPASILAGSGTLGIPATVSTKTPPGITVTAGRSLYLSTDTALGVPAGHQVRVQLQLPGGGTRETVPYSAVIYWVDGGTWVYARTGPMTFVRQPVVVDSVQDGVAVLSSGPPKGTVVVRVGGEELLGTEFEIEGE